MSRPRIRLADVTPTTWANGRGTTRELLRRVDAQGRLLLRLSVADVVEPGPFSALPGIDRVLVPLDGPGFSLTIEGRPVAAIPLQPIVFPGEATVAVTAIDGPSQDFNAMTGRGRARHEVSVRRGPFTGPVAGFVFVAEGRFLCSGEAEPLAAGDLVELDGRAEAPATFDGVGAAIVVESLPASAVLSPHSRESVV